MDNASSTKAVTVLLLLSLAVAAVIAHDVNGSQDAFAAFDEDIQLWSSDVDDDIVGDVDGLRGGGGNDDAAGGAETGLPDELVTKIVWARRVAVNVDSFGAVGDGVADDTQAFGSAWEKACSTKNAVFLVPKHKRYRVNATRFRGPCKSNLIIQVSGTIVAPVDPKNWDPKNPRIWLSFSKLSGVKFQGGGVIDGSGSKWWAASCKINKTNPCRRAPTALTIDSSSGIKVKDLTVRSSQQMHFTISKSDAVRVYRVQIKSPADSPNTDGIHISESTNVVLQGCRIGTGDDCISIVNASSNIRMKNIECGPGHGISIGSLGEKNSTAVVTGIVLDSATLTGTTNGLRIKTWQGGSGYVKAVRFQNVKMINVQNPIIIDQFYCDSPTTCKNQTSAVKISQVVYKNISGTSRTPNAMKFACSDTVPCSNIVLDNINLERENGTAVTFCNCAMGINYGTVRPAADCLNDDKGSTCDRSKLTTPKETHNYPVHTEL